MIRIEAPPNRPNILTRLLHRTPRPPDTAGAQRHPRRCEWRHRPRRVQRGRARAAAAAGAARRGWGVWCRDGMMCTQHINTYAAHMQCISAGLQVEHCQFRAAVDADPTEHLWKATSRV